MSKDNSTYQIFRESECPPQDVLILYVQGQLPAGQTRQVEMHLLDCGLCSDTVDTIQAMGPAAFTKAVAKVQQRLTGLTPEKGGDNVTPDAKVIPFKPRRRWLYAVAASVAIIVTAVLVVPGGGQGDFEVLEYAGQLSLSQVRSTSGAAKDLFDRGNYLEAARASSDSVDKGICYVCANLPDSAALHLQPFLDQDGRDGYAKVLWAYALAQAEKHDYAEALQYARKAADVEEKLGNPTYSKKQTKKILKALEAKASGK